MAAEVKTLYEVLVNTPQSEFSPIITVWGNDTEFEAVSHVAMDYDNGNWSGFLIFKGQRFSPPDIVPGLQFKYRTPSCGNGALADQLAGDMWGILVNIFKGLLNLSRGNDKLSIGVS